MSSPKAIILYTDGINTEYETKYVLDKVGFKSDIVHLNDLINREKRIGDYQLMFFPGGFSYGDDIMSGKIFAKMLTNHIKEDLQKFIAEDKLIIGICNGFQIMVRLGLLPFRNVGIEQPEASLCHNVTGHHEDHWIRMRVNKTKCVFFQGLEGTTIDAPVAHGEGQFVTSPENLARMNENNQIVVQYIDHNGNPTQEHPYNPNGAMEAIAGICDETGRIFAMMPHPERNCRLTNHPNWHTFPKGKKPDGLAVFENAAKYFK